MDANEKKPQQINAQSRAPREGDDKAWSNWGQSMIEVSKSRDESGPTTWTLSEAERAEINRRAGEICDPENTGRVNMWEMLAVSERIRDEYLKQGRKFS